MAVPAAFQLAKQLRQAPKKIAARTGGGDRPDPGRRGDGSRGQRVHQHPARSRRVRGGAAARRLRRGGRAPARRSSSSTPTSIPTRRRTSGTCATPRWATPSCACCARSGNRVEVQNYIDNTGVQVADVVVGFHFLEKKIAGGRAGAARRPGGAVRLLLLGPVRAHLELLQGPPGSAGVAQRRRCTRSKRARARWRNWRTWWPTRSCRRT